MDNSTQLLYNIELECFDTAEERDFVESLIQD